MITEHDLDEAIAECEGQRNPTASTCMKLAAFYTIKDKMYPDESMQPIEPVTYSRSSGPIISGTADRVSDTDFARMVEGMDTNTLIPIMDELMSSVQVVCPRLYAGVMRKLSEL